MSHDYNLYKRPVSYDSRIELLEGMIQSLADKSMKQQKEIEKLQKQTRNLKARILWYTGKTV